MEENLEMLRGTVKRVVFSSAETGFTVIELESNGFTETAVGKFKGISAGEEVELVGKYVIHSTYGQQFKAESFIKTLPSGSVAILRYLSSGVIKGIGPKTAKIIVSRFGDATFDVMENEPLKLAEIKGISEKRALEIQKEIAGHRSLRELCLRLSKYGLSAEDSVAVYNVLGDGADQKIEGNPYLLCMEEIGFDFERADEIAMSLNLAQDNTDRLCAGVLYVIGHNHINGHTCLPREKVIEVSARLLDCDSRLLDDAIEILLERKVIAGFKINEIDFVASIELFEREKYISNRLKTELLLGVRDKPVTEKEFFAVGKKLGIEPDELQREAVMKSITSGLFILTGGPGTGKTTTVNSIINIMETRGLKVALAAPTGRAAKRMTELTGREAKTIHRLLEVGTSDDGKKHIFVKNEKNPLDYDAVIIDEMSMVDVALFEALLKALRIGTRLILVGDSDQLPSVSAGNVLKDLIASGKFECIRLKKVFRQAEQSTIITNAHRIINGDKAELDRKDSDFFFIEAKTSQRALGLVRDLCCQRLPEAYGFSPKEDIQVLCPSRKMELGTVNINNILQSELNPSKSDKPEITFKGFVLRCGDKVMQTKNNYDIMWEDDNKNVGMGVFNGDVGTLETIDVENRILRVRFFDRVAEYIGDDVMQLEPAYAVTVHKSQGSEFDCVILPLLDFPYQLKFRNLLYTAVTRAKKMLIVVGSREVFNSMAANDRKTLRYTALEYLLGEEPVR